MIKPEAGWSFTNRTFIIRPCPSQTVLPPFRSLTNSNSAQTNSCIKFDSRLHTVNYRISHTLLSNTPLSLWEICFLPESLECAICARAVVGVCVGVWRLDRRAQTNLHQQQGKSLFSTDKPTLSLGKTVSFGQDQTLSQDLFSVFEQILST